MVATFSGGMSHAWADSTPEGSGKLAQSNNSDWVVTNTSPEGSLEGFLHSTEKSYACENYHQIITPEGKQSAYPYYTGHYHDVSSSGVHATGGSGGVSKRQGKAIIDYLNTGTTHGTLRSLFDCSGQFPDENIKSIDMEPATGVTATSAVVHATVESYNWTRVPALKYHVEYGSEPGDYSKRTPDQRQDKDITHQIDPHLSIPVTGMEPGKKYHYRVVVDQGDDYYTSGLQWYRNYGSLENYFTTVEAPAAGGMYQISSMHSGNVVDVPEWSHDSGKPLQAYQANGGENQQWKLVDAGNGYVQVRSVNSPTLCMDIRGGVISGAGIIQYTCDANGKNQQNQLWKPVQQDDGSYTLQAPGGQLVLTETQIASVDALTASPLPSNGKAQSNQKWSFTGI
jgi:hypothetical protein